jgi:hypothetical protein
MLKGLRLAGIASLALVVITMTAGAAAATTATTAIATHHHKSRICTGTLKSPGVLAGTYRGDVLVIGVCNVNGGRAVIHGDLILAPGSVLNATFALNDVRKKGKSSLSVHGDVKVGRGATLAMGCEPKEQPCSDDPNAGTGGTLTGSNRVSGDIEAEGALAVLLHASDIRGDVIMIGGGGGVTCAIPTTGIFSVLKSPVFSDAEDNSIRGDLWIAALRTCWMGALRNQVRGSVFTAFNKMADPDANEVLANVIRGSIACFANTPATQYGDSMSSPNKVRGKAFGECAFNVKKPNPAPNGPLTPISVKT